MTTPLFKDQFVTVIEEAKVMMSVLAVRRTAPDASANDAAEYSILQETTAMLDDLEAAANEHLETLRRQLRDSGNRIDRHAMYDDTLLGDLQRGLSAVELAQALGLSEEDVFQLESDGQLFSINCSSTRGEHELLIHFESWATERADHVQI
jgi:DNA-directed RNA polymerase specialized sigma subunit